MIEQHNTLELLAPAQNLSFGMEAINHGADAVYIGGPQFGARAAVGNSVDEIATLADYAHRFGARVYVALNTLLTDAELPLAEKLVQQLWLAGADALIVQDMGLLQLDLPPIALHASTQLDNRTPEKVRFLEQAGFSQVVLARELLLEQIRAIAAATPVTLECFVHGALCVSYSGQCYISHALTGRSANRGECAQLCRLPCSLTSGSGKVLSHQRHLLSLKDMNQSANLRSLLEAGVRSFKIEGRLKDLSYVKNVTAWYRQQLDVILDERPELARASDGRCHFSFTPDPARSFNRGATDYFLHGRQSDITAFDSPKSLGQPAGTVSKLGKNWFEVSGATDIQWHNGDGICYFSSKGQLVGLRINRAEGNRLFPAAAMAGLKPGLRLYRNHDQAFVSLLEKPSAKRRIPIRMVLCESDSGVELQLTDPHGTSAGASLALEKTPASQPEKAIQALKNQLAKLGDTLFMADDIALQLSQPWFIPLSQVKALRRQATDHLEAARRTAYRRPLRRPAAGGELNYPQPRLTYQGNVLNHAAEAFYRQHGVSHIEPAYEADARKDEVVLMVCKHCLRHSLDLCPKQNPTVRPEPLTLQIGKESLRLRFDCRKCEMQVLGRHKGTM